MGKINGFNIQKEVETCFVSYLDQRSLRKTPERLAILNEIYSFAGHFDVETLCNRMKSKKFSVSKATVYNTIELLLQSNLVVKHSFDKNSPKYEKSFNNKQHNHVVFMDSNEIKEFCDPRILEIQQSIEKQYNIKVINHSLTFFAIEQNGK